MLPNYYHAIRRLKAFTSKCKVTVCVVPNDTRQNLLYAMQTFRDENPNIYVEFLTQRDFSIAERCLLNGEIDYLIAHDPLHEQEQIEKPFCRMTRSASFCQRTTRWPTGRRSPSTT
ncbi:hypothetical protein NIA69_03550 [Gemmiger formicilis]|nr:hypothetical protein [Gemmiger formicilis]